MTSMTITLGSGFCQIFCECSLKSITFRQDFHRILSFRGEDKQDNPIANENPVAKEKDYAKGQENRDTNLEKREGPM